MLTFNGLHTVIHQQIELVTEKCVIAHVFCHRVFCAGKINFRLVTERQNNILTSLNSFVDTYCKLVTPATNFLPAINIKNVLVLRGVAFFQFLKNGFAIYSYPREMEMKADGVPVRGKFFTRNHLGSYVSI
jgi:hypothetical protein